jgi:hypothetical protein
MLPQGILKAHLFPKLLGHADIKLTLDIYSHRKHLVAPYSIATLLLIA